MLRHCPAGIEPWDWQRPVGVGRSSEPMCHAFKAAGDTWRVEVPSWAGAMRIMMPNTGKWRILTITDGQGCKLAGFSAVNQGLWDFVVAGTGVVMIRLDKQPKRAFSMNLMFQS